MSVAEFGVDETLHRLSRRTSSNIASYEAWQLRQSHRPGVGHMRSDQTVLEIPQRMTVGQRLGIRYVEGGPSDLLSSKRGDEGLRID